MLQEWNKRWGTPASTFPHRAANVSPVKVPVDCGPAELLDMVRKGKEALSQLESVGAIDLRSIQTDEFRGLMLGCFRVVSGLCQRITQAKIALERRSHMQTC